MMTKHKPIKVGYDLDMFENHNVQLPIFVDLTSALHWLICGSSGSGKSYLTLMLLRNILIEYGCDIKLWILDFKNSNDYACCKDYSHYYTGADCEKGLENFYEEYQKVKDGTIQDSTIRLLVFDEWAGFQIWETQQNKKQAEKYKGYLLEILLMGRSMLCGVWVIMQRNDAKFIEGREQFFVTIALGKMSRELKQMVMQGEDLEQKQIYAKGEGTIRMDSARTRFLKVPRLKSVGRVQQQIKDCLVQADSTEGAGSQAPDPVL